MPIGLFNPKDNINATSSRPAHSNLGAAVRRWFTDTGAGTRIHAQDLNAVVAQFRGAMDAYGITDEEGDDTILTQLMNAVLTPKHNFIQNPSFELWQAGTSFTSGYLADLWKARTGADATYSRQAGFSGARYCLRMQRNAGSASVALPMAWHVLTTGAAFHLAGKPLKVSADIRSGADWSPGGKNVICRMVTGTGIEETSNTGGTFPTGSVAVGVGAGVTTTAQRVVWNFAAIAANATQILARFEFTPVGVAGAADFVEITNVKVEASSLATPFIPASFDATLAAARRFYQKSFNDSVDPAQNVGAGTGEHRFPAMTAGATTQRSATIRLPVPLRAAPTVTLFNPAAANGQVRDVTAAADCSSAAAGNISEKGFSVTCTGNASTAVGNHLGVHWVADARTF